MLSNESRKSSRLRALAIVPAVAVALLVVNQPSVAGTLSTINNSELSVSDDKGSKKTEKSTITIKRDTTDLNIDGLQGTAVTYYLNGEKISLENLKKLDNSKITNVSVNKNNETSTVNVYTNQDDKDIKSVKVIRISDSDKNDVTAVKVDGKSQINAVYIDGKEILVDELEKIDPDKIESMTVKKEDKTIYIKLKK